MFYYDGICVYRNMGVYGRNSIENNALKDRYFQKAKFFLLEMRPKMIYIDTPI